MTDPTAEQSGEDPQPRRERSWWQAFKDSLPWSATEPTVREAIAELIEEGGEPGAPMDAHERLLLTNILRLRDVTAADVMMPRADIVAAAIDTALPELVRRIVEEGVSRMPVYRETLDDAVGLVHIKDAVRHMVGGGEASLSRILRPILFVAPSMRVLDLLLEMRVKRTHMALVIDEYGGVDGLVTIEDLVEQIVGEIDDEHDIEEDPELVWRADTVLEADARVSIEDFEHVVGPLLTPEERDDVDTLGGLVFAIAGHIPARGELVPHSSGIEFQIVDADPRRIKRLRVRNLPPGTRPGDAS
ncbi:Magnesium and cobalt efflux protein CorC [uncultured Alphaproteobacteria bacterium]|uniref:Magnesium and cobalt efflux protein CorC n=1 Tax=uncultured Alphaproteobacteria bacterium TaxID=91750 RepID=A0A212K9X3_9PROT|nr:Magnesium and cobalt efflux protein CorC [uncultured Alphaproteobacteria bacterium]